MARKPAYPATSAVSKYLARHAEPEAAAASDLPGEFGHAIVVPAYGEEDSLFATLGSVSAGPGGDVLVVLVLNARADSPPEVHRANAAARETLARTLGEPRPLSGEALVYPVAHGRLAVIDRASPGRY